MNAAACAAPNNFCIEEHQLKMGLFAADNVDHNTLTIDGKINLPCFGNYNCRDPNADTVLTISRKEMKHLYLVKASKFKKIVYCAAMMSPKVERIIVMWKQLTLQKQ